MAYGYTAPDGAEVSAFRDRIDGGGAGTSGDRFEGSPISGLLNFLGIRPAGYAERQRQAAMPQPGRQFSRPTARPHMPPPSQPVATGGVLSQVFPFQPEDTNAGRYAGDPLAMLQPEQRPDLAALIEALSGSPYPVRTSLDGLASGATMSRPTPSWRY